MNLKGAIITWPFALPVPKQRTLGGYYPEESVLANRDACIAAALRWAARVAGPVSDKPCCGCIVESGEGGYYSQCDCGNYGDAERAAAWCADANTSRAILAALPKDEAK